MKLTRIFALVIAILMICIATGCNSYIDEDKRLTKEEACIELDALLKKVDVTSVTNPVMDIYSDDIKEADSLADISVFPLTVKGNGEINIEIAADTELSCESPDDWGNIMAQRFNKEGKTINGKRVTVSIRQITGGEVVTYMRVKGYRPDLFIPSHGAWGKMLDASGLQTITLANRVLGNTAGILISDKVYDKYIEKYHEASIKTIVEANLNGDLTFAYTNPYTSSTGLNMLTMILKAFDPQNPVSEAAAEKLYAYQRTSPPTAYNTAVMRNKAAKGLLDAMVMEEQAYIFTKALSNYIYVPQGIRHDHPAFTFEYVDAEKQEAARMFVEYCLTDSAQKLGYDKGFNRHDEYQGEEPGLDGNGYLEAQSLWKQNKNGGIPTVAVFVADTSGSMQGSALNELKRALIASSPYISSENYIGLVSYSGNVVKHLDVKQFDDQQRAYFAGEIKALKANGSTATYDAVLVGLQMLREFTSNMPECRPLLFVLTDGQTNVGWGLDRVLPVVGGLDVPVYTIAFNYTDGGALEKLAQKNEAALISTDTAGIVNELRNLFNIEG